MATLAEIHERLAREDSEQLWWTWRSLEIVLDAQSRGSTTAHTIAVGVDCFLRLAAADPDWATAKLGERGPFGNSLATLLGEGRLDAALTRLAPLETVKGDAMLRASMLVASASWTRPADDARVIWERAWTELQRVPVDQRNDESWKRAAESSAAYVDYSKYLELATERLEETTDPFWRASALAAAIPVAARHSDWPTFERWIESYRALPEPFRRGHDECAVYNLEGVRALDEGRLDDAEAAMRSVVELAAGLMFLSNPEITSLSKRLRSEGFALSLCDAFDALVTKRDWRLLRP